MTYPESLDWLNASGQFGIKLGLSNIRLLLEGLRNPQDALACLHVAGTNGKGSVCAFLDAVLRAHGKKTGLYTSPHLVDFRERIRVDGKKISQDDVAAGLTRIREVASGWDRQPTYFEITTALALEHFAREGCDFVVLETGMGGRLDATNAVEPVVSVITPVSLDHCQWLGQSVTEIAREKAGIIKRGIPVVSAVQDPAVAAVLSVRAEECASEISFVSQSAFDFPVGLKGSHQPANAALALTALGQANLKLDPDTVRKALREIHWPGRFQVIDQRIVLDGAHNPHAAAGLVRSWRECFAEAKPIVIFGALVDKDFSLILERLEAVAQEFYFVPVKSPRSAPPEELAACCRCKSTTFPSLREALEAARGLTLVTGSLFLVGEAMEILQLEV